MRATRFWLQLVALVIVTMGCTAPGITRGPLQTPAAQSPPSTEMTAYPDRPQTAQNRTDSMLEVDLDGDSQLETIAASQQGSQPGILVLRDEAGRTLCEIMLPSGAAFTSLRAEDMDGDRRPEILAYAVCSETNTHFLVLVSPGTKQEKGLASDTTTADGSPIFASAYYPPWVVDLDGDAIPEIVVATQGADAQYLDSVAYQLVGRRYERTSLFMLPPRLVPTQAPR